MLKLDSELQYILWRVRRIAPRISNEISKGNHKVLKEYTLELIKRRQELQHTKIKTRDTKKMNYQLYTN